MTYISNDFEEINWAVQERKMRKIDGKFHIENNQIVKTSNGDIIPEDEPLFLLRARDHLALQLLEFYNILSLNDSCTDYHLKGIQEALKQFKAFKEKFPERMKQPGITRGL